MEIIKMGSLQHFAPPEHAETYDIPDHHGINILEVEIKKQKRHIKNLRKDIDFIYHDTDNQLGYMSRLVDQIMVHRKRIKECQDAIGWIMARIRH